MCIDDYVAPNLRPRADNTAGGNIGAWTDHGIFGQNHGGMHKSRRAQSRIFGGMSQCLPGVVVPYGNSKSDILPGKLLGSFLEGSMHKMAAEAHSSLFRGVIGVAEYLPWQAADAITISRCVHLLGDPRKLGS
jgi:hypothetical protein